MRVTSAQANKLLRQLQDEKDLLVSQEAQSRIFVAATTENLEDARPEYDYAAVQQQISKLDQKIRAVKHSISLFNTTTEVHGFGMTIDQMLVYIPQLVSRKGRLERMSKHPPKARLTTSARSNIIEYEYANYDVGKAQKDLRTVAEEIASAQFALEQVNSSEEFEIDL